VVIGPGIHMKRLLHKVPGAAYPQWPTVEPPGVDYFRIDVVAAQQLPDGAVAGPPKARPTSPLTAEQGCSPPPPGNSP